MEPFVTGFIETKPGPAPRVATALSLRDRLDAAAVRSGIGRGGYKVVPGLYCVGEPGPDAPVLVTANYKLTFDAVRAALAGENVWLLVADTRGVNVWCAAGKGLFSTDEVAHAVRASRLSEVVSHRDLILPQLSATGVAARGLRRRCGFGASFGPIRAVDLPAFLRAGKADEAMRSVTFTLKERAELIPVELYLLGKPLAIFLAAAFLLAGIGPDVFSPGAAWTRGLAAALATLLGIAAGDVIVPLALPRLPLRHFALKGALSGAVLGIANLLGPGTAWDLPALWLWTVTLAAWLAMNFTGSTPFTSPTGVEREMRRALPVMALAALAAAALWLAAPFLGRGA